ncbi:hypothetical protein PSI9734_02259 [Pseudidiomarina piscicola]|uniref:DUF7668 domain-containing protein n=1 Tax=Pseudidiomarina piscicola TaxID=2614830 RepID=A0A6S6WM65_9GAMM|nr:hypothetical protein [Pseudidiomarina piscicola]CAB0151898.1 hypothetical protein PSI9734_02259 [Pseudidiomarina piscicola]VZT41344.1 hypothetical protein PSI9734_02259 [Pseudomonas aeruginosa]
MTLNAPVSKDEVNQQPIPTIWRSALWLIVEAIKSNDYSLTNTNSSIKPISLSDATRIQENIEDYGCKLASLPDQAWNTSVCQWMRGYWDILVDLYTVQEGGSDLVLSVRVYEQDNKFEFEIMSVHVE